MLHSGTSTRAALPRTGGALLNTKAEKHTENVRKSGSEGQRHRGTQECGIDSVLAEGKFFSVNGVQWVGVFSREVGESRGGWRSGRVARNKAT